MTKTERYMDTLRSLNDWDGFLMQESGLPGPRANLELVQAVADAGDEALFLRYLDGFPPEIAPTNTPGEFMAVCGAVGLGRLVSEGRQEHLLRLRALAGDPRWRVREGVAMALQRLGRKDMARLLAEMDLWSRGTAFEQRAVVAGLCEPDLLEDPLHARQVLDRLGEITAGVEKSTDRKSEGFIALRKALGYGWSVATVALPDYGKALMERWLSSADKDVRWIMRENLKKNRLIRMDAEWVERLASSQ